MAVGILRLGDFLIIISVSSTWTWMYPVLSHPNILQCELSFRIAPFYSFWCCMYCTDGMPFETSLYGINTGMLPPSFFNFLPVNYLLSSLETTTNTSYSFFPRTMPLQLQSGPLAVQVGKQQIGRRKVVRTVSSTWGKRTLKSSRQVGQITFPHLQRVYQQFDSKNHVMKTFPKSFLWET